MTRALKGTPVEPQNSLNSVPPVPELRQLHGSICGDPIYQKSISLPSCVNVSNRDSPTANVFDVPSTISAKRMRLQPKNRPSRSLSSSERPTLDVLWSSESAVDEATPR